MGKIIKFTVLKKKIIIWFMILFLFLLLFLLIFKYYLINQKKINNKISLEIEIDYSNLGFFRSINNTISYLENMYPLTYHKAINWDNIRTKVNIVLGNNYKKNFISAFLTLISLIPDGNVSFFTEKKFSKNFKKEREKFILGSYGFSIRENNNNHIIVTYVFPNSAAERLGIKVGQIVERYNGKPISYYLLMDNMPEIYKWGITLNNYLGIPFINPTNIESKRLETLNYLTRNGINKMGNWVINGKEFDLLTFNDNYECLFANKNQINLNENDLITLKFIENKIAYLKITEVRDYYKNGILIHWKKKLDEYFDIINKISTGLIIDLRCNIGGINNFGKYFAEQIINEKKGTYTILDNNIVYGFQKYSNNFLESHTAHMYGLDKFIKKSQTQSIIDFSYKLPNKLREKLGPSFIYPKNTYSGPLVCLINNDCMGCGEELAKACDNAYNSKIIGMNRTNGSNSINGGKILLGKQENLEVNLLFPIGVRVDAYDDIIIDTDFRNNGGVLPNNKIPATNKNLIEFSKNSVNKFRLAKRKKLNYFRTYDIELEYAKKYIKNIVNDL